MQVSVSRTYLAILFPLREPRPVLLDIHDDLISSSVILPRSAQSCVSQAFGISLPRKIVLHQIHQDIPERTFIQSSGLPQLAVQLVWYFYDQFTHVSPDSNCTFGLTILQYLLTGPHCGITAGEMVTFVPRV